MSRKAAFAAIVATVAMLMSATPVAQAASSGAPAPAGTQPTKISPGEYDKFMSGLSAYQYNMDGLEQMFTANANMFRMAANEIAPLIGQEDSVSKAALQTQLDAVNVNIPVLAKWKAETRAMHDKACTWFLKRYLRSWSTQREKGRMTKGVEGMREAFHQFFDSNVVALQDAAARLAEQDVSGFWERLAIAEGGQAFSRQAFDKAYRGLLRM